MWATKSDSVLWVSASESKWTHAPSASKNIPCTTLFLAATLIITTHHQQLPLLQMRAKIASIKACSLRRCSSNRSRGGTVVGFVLEMAIQPSLPLIALDMSIHVPLRDTSKVVHNVMNTKMQWPLATQRASRKFLVNASHTP